MSFPISEPSILMVDDHAMVLGLMAETLRSGGYRRLYLTTDPREAPALFRTHRPDLVLLDYHMPEMDGLQVLDELRRAQPAEEFLPIVLLTGDGAEETKVRALAAGADDFLTKPPSRAEVLLRVRNLLYTRWLSLEHVRHNRELERRVRERTRELDESRTEVLERLALAADYRDDVTGRHARRVAEVAALIAERLGLSAAEAELIGRAALLHDVGKIGIDDAILRKPGRYTPEERERMQAHAALGGELLAGSRSAVLQLAEQIARTHHERWDGDGYARSLRGDEIPLAGRIVAAADVLDALLSARPYKQSWTLDQAMTEIALGRGRQFDPRVVDELEALVETGVLDRIYPAARVAPAAAAAPAAPALARAA